MTCGRATDLAPAAALRAVMTANGSIIVERRDDTLGIPNAALRFRPRSEQAATNGASPGSGAPPPGRNTVSPGRRTPSPDRDAGLAGPIAEKASEGGDRSEGGKHRKHDHGGPQRTVYTRCARVDPPGEDSPEEICPVQIKVGLSDGRSTEVVEGLEEGDEVVVGANGATPGAQDAFGDTLRRLRDWA